MENMHDKLFKQNLSILENAIAFIEATFPEHIKSTLDLVTLESLNKSFVADDLKELFSDVLFKVKVASGGEAYCSLLIEHKSYSDDYVLFQLGLYIFSAYHEQIKNKEKLRLVIPMVYYHNNSNWEPRSLLNHFASFPKTLQGFVPSFDLLFTNVNSRPDAEILKIRNIAISSMMLTHKHKRNVEAILDNLLLLYNTLQTNEERNSFKTVSVYIMYYLKFEKDANSRITQYFKNSKNNILMSLYEEAVLEIKTQARIEGMKEGIKEGKMEGKMEGEKEAIISVIKSSYAKGLSIQMISDITGLPVNEVQAIINETTKTNNSGL